MEPPSFTPKLHLSTWWDAGEACFGLPKALHQRHQHTAPQQPSSKDGHFWLIRRRSLLSETDGPALLARRISRRTQQHGHATCKTQTVTTQNKHIHKPQNNSGLTYYLGDAPDNM